MKTLILEGLSHLRLIGLAVLCGGVTWAALLGAGQKWAKTYSNTVTYLLLPSIGLVIVRVISESIALSLGMIGALSIVRFRHPVKSPLELVIYFLLLTVGVSLTTRPFLGMFLTSASATVIVAVSQISKLVQRRGGSLFPLAHSDGERALVLEVTAKAPVDILEDCSNLVFMHADLESSSYAYRLALGNRSSLDEWRLRLSSIADVQQMSCNYQ